MKRWYGHPAIVWSALSGAAALMIQVVLQKVFSYVLGGSLLSTTIVVGSYMAGLALGGFLAGRFGDNLKAQNGLPVYLVLETAIGLLGLGSLIAYVGYLTVMEDLLASPTMQLFLSSTPFRAALSFLILLPLTTVIGATLPILTRGVQAAPGGGVTVTGLYTANLLGALSGVIVASYLVMPYLGLWGAAGLACGCNLTVSGWVLAFRRIRHPPAMLEPLPVPSDSAHGERLSFTVSGLLAFASGLVLFALEILWTHLLAAVIGNTVYAFADMLFSVLLALFLAARREARAGVSREPLAGLVLLGGVWLAVSIPFYALSPFVFSALGVFPLGFLARELVRLAVACLLIVPAGLALARIFPRLLSVGIAPDRASRGVGTLLAFNTIGCLAGLFLGKFVLIPVLGSEYSLKALAVVLGLTAAIVDRRVVSRARIALVALALLALVAPVWKPTLLLSNRSTYFAARSDAEYDPLLYLGEDAETGFVTVARRSDGAIEMRTNGKFEGDDAGQLEAQRAFGLLPALAARETRAAFVIGCGTAVTVQALGGLPFERIHLAELSGSVLHAAREYFGEVNGGILDDPRVTVIQDDGRNALSLSPDRYDVVSIEITSIWFAGAANLYSRDFYRLVRHKLAPGGVFQQWVQLHHMRLEDLRLLLNTAVEIFPHVALWYTGEQGQLLASDSPLLLDWHRLQALSPTVRRLPFQQLLDEDGIRSLLREVRAGWGATVSSDLFPVLEYATPKGNALASEDQLSLTLFRRLFPRPRQVPLRDAPPDELLRLQSIFEQQP